MRREPDQRAGGMADHPLPVAWPAQLLLRCGIDKYHGPPQHL